MPRNAFDTIFHTIPRRKLRDGIEEQLLAALEHGTYAIGAELPSERELMVQMGVGRPAVREALMALEHRGLITISHGRRARVRAADVPDASELAKGITLAKRRFSGRDHASGPHLAEARALFEATVVRLAAQRATPSGIVLLKRALSDNRRAIPDAAEYLATDMGLHRTIAALSGNPLLAAAGEAMYTWLPQFRIQTVHVKGANLLSYDEHARIVECIVGRDPDGAAKAIETHLARSHSLYERLGAVNVKAPVVASTKASGARLRRHGS